MLRLLKKKNSYFIHLDRADVPLWYETAFFFLLNDQNFQRRSFQNHVLNHASLYKQPPTFEYIFKTHQTS